MPFPGIWMCACLSFILVYGLFGYNMVCIMSCLYMLTLLLYALKSIPDYSKLT